MDLKCNRQSIIIIVVLSLTLIAYVGWRHLFPVLTSTALTGADESTQLRGKVGLLVGHWKRDSGAVCLDGIKEVDVNLTIAQLVADLLQRRGYEVDLLAESDRRLDGYKADIFIALHADSCVPHAHGFKVAGPTESKLITENPRLIECLWSNYEATTGLTRQPAGITRDMLEYHAFRRIDPMTPAAIIEMGFISTDRAILLDQPERAARGIVKAIECFLDQK
jgi:hypothetical protein